ncbi:RNA binding protein [Trypanosoma grayi]|uniref:RNA binding protein n=1 Tax=Trypanosoma grayi TaxID=71804 RepID=UPI0004F49155|nr:RNA binding protein [Trypanosoma grayi]KEG12019.1 RNA binding protein [Trypanosoma grayi]
MVSFTCSFCQDVVKKPKVVGHANSCRGASFTCVDCMEVFDLNSIKAHTSCITETEKYQGRWRQKATAAVPRKRTDSESDEDGDSGKRQPLRPPRPPMDLSSDSDDDTWVTSKKKATATKESPVKGKKCSEKPNGSPRKRGRAESTPPHTAEVAAAPSHGSTRRRLERLELPRAMTEADCIVPSFVLGTDAEVAEVAGWIIDEAAPAPLGVRALAKKMVESYNARIAKHVQHAIEAAIRNGKLREQDGVVKTVS